ISPPTREEPEIPAEWVLASIITLDEPDEVVVEHLRRHQGFHRLFERMECVGAVRSVVMIDPNVERYTRRQRHRIVATWTVDWEFGFDFSLPASDDGEL